MERRKLCSLVKAVVPERKIPHAYRGILLQWYMVGSYQGPLSAIFDFVPMIKLVSCVFITGGTTSCWACSVPFTCSASSSDDSQYAS
jgi:hypothetical protein